MCISAFTQALKNEKRGLNCREKMNMHHTDHFGVVAGFSWRLARLATFKIDLWTVSQSLFYAVCTRVWFSNTDFHKDLHSSVRWDCPLFSLSPVASDLGQDQFRRALKDPGYCSRHKESQCLNLVPTLSIFENPAIEDVCPDLEGSANLMCSNWAYAT